MKFLMSNLTSHLKIIYNRFVYINISRIRGLEIGRKCGLSRSSILHGKNKVGNYTILGENLELHEGASVRNHCNLSRITVGRNSIIDSDVRCVGYGKGKIIIGENSYIGISNILDHSNNIEIGDFVHIAGSSTCLWTHSTAKACLSSVKLNDLSAENIETAPIKIENNVYIGGNCTIYPGVHIHEHAIITPNSVVISDIDPHTMVGGNPAKIIKKLG